MAELKLTIPDGNTCDECQFRTRNNDVKDSQSYHCAIFRTRADSVRPKICNDASKQPVR